MRTGSPPRQPRAARTRERIVRAALRLLQSRPFEQITVAEIVAAADSSVGSFYARFGEKHGLLPHLYAVYDRNLRKGVERALHEFEQAETLADLARRYVQRMIATYRRRRELMRTVALYARTHPDAIPAEVFEHRSALQARLGRIFSRFHARIRHPDPAAAVRIGLFMISAAARDKLLFDAPHARSTPISDDALRTELTRALIRYLTAGDLGG